MNRDGEQHSVDRRKEDYNTPKKVVKFDTKELQGRLCAKKETKHQSKVLIRNRMKRRKEMK